MPSVLVVLALLLAACSQANQQDARLRQAVIQRLSSDPVLAGLAIGVSASNGTVTISGLANTDAQRQAAAADANIVGAVTQVVNQVQSLQALQAALQQRLGADLALKGASIQVLAGSGGLVLTGVAASGGQKSEAEAVAHSVLAPVPGAKLADQIAVATPPPPPPKPTPVPRRAHRVAERTPQPRRLQPEPVPIAQPQPAAAPPTVHRVHQFLAVSVEQPWAGNTGIMLEPGDRVSVRADGIVNFSGRAPFDAASGEPWSFCSRLDGYAAPGRPCYSLVGKIGNGQPFEVGSNATFTADRSGILYLGANERSGGFVRDSGSWAVNVDVVEFGAAQRSAEAASEAPRAPASRAVPESAPPVEAAPLGPPPASQPPAIVTVPSGTVLEVRLDHSLASNTSAAGETFTGTLAAPILVNGQIAVPEGALVSGEVLFAHSAGHLEGQSELRLTVYQLSYNGNRYALPSAPWDQKAAPRGKNTAKKAGIGAVAGGILGGILGGAKGAIAGASAGAGGGVAAQALTGPAEVTLPAEDVIRVSLSAPLQVRPAAAFRGP